MAKRLPFDRVGLELELLTPPRRTRVDVATALARRLNGRVEYGFKYFSEGRLTDGRPLCQLSLAARIVDHAGVLATLVDDNTLRDGLSKRPLTPALRATDELRLALLIERQGWSPSPERRLDRLKELFGGVLDGGTLLDAAGHPLVVTLKEPASWQRVCEVVTRPVNRPERRRLVRAILDVTRDQGCTVPRSAALHAHYDAAPWRSVRALSALILRHASDRERWWHVLEPNPACKKLAPFPAPVVRLAHDPKGVGFKTFAAALSLAGARKECDLNICGVIEPHPRQPTLEVRCLPMSLDPDDVLSALAKAEALLAEALDSRRFPRGAR